MRQSCHGTVPVSTSNPIPHVTLPDLGCLQQIIVAECCCSKLLQMGFAFEYRQLKQVFYYNTCYLKERHKNVYCTVCA
jgi:hypothetical protein